jgi:cephalosporin hydroxylase
MTYQNEKEFAKLLEHFKALTPKHRVLEIGSLMGDTLTEWMTSMDLAGIIVSIDVIVGPTDPRHRKQKDGHQIYWPRRARALGLEFYCFNDDSTNPITVANTKSILPEVDFLFIDGGHDYNTVLADWKNYSPLVRSGGMVAFHDIGMPDVRRVWEMARKGTISVEISEKPNEWGIGVLYK